MTRIIAGTAKGRRLQTPSGEHTRPTTDRVREALFSAVESWCGSLHGLHVLDLYAGSGAVGLEAWSRGAASVTLVEADRPTAALVAANARTLGCPVAEVVGAKVRQALARPAAHAYDLVYVDPPYALSDDDLAGDLELVAGLVAPDALVVVERSRRSPEPRWPEGLVGERSKRYGESVLWYGRAASQEAPEAQEAQEERSQ